MKPLKSLKKVRELYMEKKMAGIVISPGCTLKCLFCPGNQKLESRELKKREVEIYKNLIHLRKKGHTTLIISGGDPIEYNRIIELIRYTKKIGFNHVSLMTHGTRLEEPTFLNRLIASGIDRIQLPLYGSKPSIHDEATQTPGSFESIIAGVKDLIKKSPDIEVVFQCLIIKQNKEDLCDIVDFVSRELNLNNLLFSIPCLIKKNDDNFYVPLKELAPYTQKVYNYALKVNKKICFTEIPFCIFGEYNPINIKNSFLDCGPPDLGKYNQPSEEMKTSIPDLPTYRIKKKTNLCDGCKASESCDGFFVNDIEKYGTKGIKKL